MTAVLLTSLFIAAGLLATTTIGANWHRYGAAVRAIPTALACCADSREVRVRISEVRVRPTAIVLRPAFKTAGQRPSELPAQPAALPAAA
jgi:hypothetical protein